MLYEVITLCKTIYRHLVKEDWNEIFIHGKSSASWADRKNWEAKPTLEKYHVFIGRISSGPCRITSYNVCYTKLLRFTSMGVDVEILGVMPTPAVAQITKYVRADLGVMITASHNPYTDNGIKFFGPDGYKFSDDFEFRITSYNVCYTKLLR